MDTKKLDKWADLLLDTGKRNNLVNFKDTKASTVEVLLPSSDVLFKKVDGTASFEVFDPKTLEIDDESEYAIKEPEVSNTSDKRSAFLAKYSKKITRKNQILLYSNATANPYRTVKNIDKKTREFIEETGVNVAYMAFGFIHWKESDSSSSVYRAPILLVPIQLEQASAIDPYFIKSAEDEIIVNPTFSYKMEAEYGLKLPEYNHEDLTAYLEKVNNLVARLRWTVTAECKIGIFSFLKINMYRDLKDNASAILANQNIRRLLGEPSTKESMLGTDITRPNGFNPLSDLHSVVDADSSQIEAIEMAKSGKSFVLQGPPGTGKSQTITNIIAECLCDGKKVLFVSEKLAALNVVYDKLKKAGLSEFCLQLHSHKANKKDVIADICHTLRKGKSAVSTRAKNRIIFKKQMQRKLDAYAAELHSQRPIIEKSLYQLFEAYSALRSMPDVEWAIPELSAKGEVYLTETSSLLEQYVAYIPSIGYDYRKNSWYGYILQDTSYQTKSAVKSNISSVVQILQELIPIQKEISEKYGIQCTNMVYADKWKTFFRFVSTTKLITPPLLNNTQFHKTSEILHKLKMQSTDVLASRSALKEVFDDDIFELNGEEYHKKLTRQFSGIFSRLFNAEYKQIIKDLRLCKKDGKKPSYSEAVSWTEQLSNYQQKSAEYAKAEEPVKKYLGEAYKGIDTDWNYINQQLSDFRSILSSGISFGSLQNYSDFTVERKSFEDYSQRLEKVIPNCNSELLRSVDGYFDDTFPIIYSAPCDMLLTRLNNCLSEMDKLDNWCHFRHLLFQLKNKQIMPYIHAAIAKNIEPEQTVGAFQKQFYYQWIDSIIAGSQVLSNFNRISQDEAVKSFSERDIEQFEINKAVIREKLSSQRPATDIIASGSALAILLRENEKKRKQKSIRALLDKTGELVQKIKPCFLMSPLSVSTFLAPDAVKFDVVVFDEASQIFPQDAIGAIYRAKQLIVVGDSKQMPPSNFFNASIEVDDNDEETGDVTDFESILDLCTTSMQQIRLRWHYRSRYEQLIAFSNKNFYDNDLVTFPSTQPDMQGIGVDYYYVEGIFDRKSHTNRKEAEYIVNLIYKNIDKYPNRSLGVVAFSLAQQDLIDKLLTKRRQESPEKEFFFKNDNNEPFFIKNLETVQGDERDTIIFSIAYGLDAQGRFLHNFGPLNREGGERRLNVAVTRAKFNVQLVSSIHYTDIDLNRTSAEGAKLLREYLDYAENGDIALERSVTVNPFEQFDSEFELEVCDFLRSRGFSVDTQVGCSGFRIDLGLKIPKTSNYVLAIECDGATYHSSKNARDRDRLRQEILERMGWQFYRIWSTDWYKNKSVEQLRLLEVAANAIKNPTKVAPKSEVNQTLLTFENKLLETHFKFPAYKAADINKLKKQYLPNDFKGMVKAILDIEAPLSEELLLKRIVSCFGREKVTKSVQKAYEEQMQGYQNYDIYRRNGFLFLKNWTKIRFRIPGDIKRDIKHIAPEELAEGMLEILKQNMTADKNGLYRSMAKQCGVSRLNKTVNACMDSALNILKNKNYIIIDGEQISLK